MSIIEKALDKALGRADDDTPAPAEPAVRVIDEPAADHSHDAPPAPAVASEETYLQEPPEPEPKPVEPQHTPVEPQLPVHALDWQVLEVHGFVRDTSHPLYDTYRAISRPVLANAFPAGTSGLQRGNLVLVTSSRVGEGKTFTALNLALTIAMDNPDRKVLLVDADMEKGSLTKLLGLAERPGLADLLENKKLGLHDTTLCADTAAMRIVPAGSKKHHPHGLLAGAAAMSLAKELAKLHADELVIFDAPPLLETPETASFAMQLGQVLLVVEAEMTPQVVVREAVAKLEFCNVVGCVLNKTTDHPHCGDMSSGYGLYNPEVGDG